MGVFVTDLRRTTRRGRPALLRAIYGLALLVALGGLFARQFPAGLSMDPPVVPRHQAAGALARFSAQFADVCAVVQLATVLILAPVVAAGAVAEERHRGTLDMLLMSDLSGWGIAAGKFASRILVLLALLLTGVPILALTLLWGGADPGAVLAGVAVNLVTAISLGALGLACSAFAGTVARAAAAAYALAALFGAATTAVPALRLINPAALYSEWLTVPVGVTGRGWLGPVLGYAAFHLPAAAVLLAVAARTIRQRAVRGEDPFAKAWRRRSVGWRADLAFLTETAVRVVRLPASSLVPGPLAMRVFPPPPIRGDPLLWRELHFGGGAAAAELNRSAGCVLTLIGAFALVPAFLVFANPATRTEAGRELTPFLASLNTILFATVMVGAALTTAGSVSRERERGTLDSLLALPAGRWAILRAKMLASLFRARWLAAGLLPVWLLLLATGGLTVTTLPLLALSGAVHAGFAASVGICLSVWTGTGRATVLSLVVLLAVSALPTALAGYVDAPSGRQLVEGVGPTRTWSRLIGPPRRWAQGPDADDAAAVLGGLVGYAAATGALLSIAAWGFGREDCRERHC